MQLERVVSKQNKILPGLSFLPEDGQKIFDALSNLDYTVKIGLNECLKCDKFGVPVLELQIGLQRLRLRSITENIAPPAVLVAISWVKLIVLFATPKVKFSEISVYLCPSTLLHKLKNL